MNIFTVFYGIFGMIAAYYSEPVVAVLFIITMYLSSIYEELRKGRGK